VLLAGIAEDVTHHGPLTYVDAAVEARIHGHVSPLQIRAFEVVSWLGSLPLMIALLLCVAAFLGWKRNWLEMATWITLIAGTLGLSVALKIMVPRPRPPGFLAMIPNDSFASGHAMIALAGYGMLVHLLNRSHSGDGAGPGITAAWIILVVVIGLSRLCLGDHYASDILAGYAAGGLCLSAAVTGLSISSRRRDGKMLKR